MRKKLLVIFFLLCCTLFLIYNKYKDKQIKVLFIGENNILNHNYNFLEYFKDNYKLNTFLYDGVTYKQLAKNIKTNDKKIVKNKAIYLNQLISSSDIIVINANNDEYFKKCKKTTNILNNYNEILSENITNLIDMLNKISYSKIVIIGNYCKNKYVSQDINNEVKYINYYDIENARDLYNKILEA